MNPTDLSIITRALCYYHKLWKVLLLCSCNTVGHTATYDFFSYPLTDTKGDCADIIRENGQLLEHIYIAYVIVGAYTTCTGSISCDVTTCSSIH